MTDKEKRKFIESVQLWAHEKFGGSRDPEVEDAVDIVDFFESMFGEEPEVFEKLLKDVCVLASRVWTHHLYVRPACRMCQIPQRRAPQ